MGKIILTLVAVLLGIITLAAAVEGMDHVNLVEDLEDALEDELSYMGEG